jgi:hypothetical protein
LLANSATIADLAGRFLADGERPYLVVENGGALEEAVAALRSGLERLSGPQLSWTPPLSVVVPDGR